MGHQDWKLKQASIQAFSILLIGLPSVKSNPMVESSIIGLLGLMQDESTRVRYSVIESMALVTEVCGVAILKHQNFIQILGLFTQELGKS